MKATIKTSVLLKAIDLELMNLLKKDPKNRRGKAFQNKAA